jgi:hypothetical protein
VRRARRIAALVLCPPVLAACASDGHQSSPRRSFSGPPDTIRVALTGVRWPLDPAFIEGRDETTLARALLATPLRTDVNGALQPGLCRTWRGSANARLWRFRCRHARTIAAGLRRIRALPYSPSGWLFGDAVRIEAAAPRTLVVQLRRPWRRFPYALTVPAAAPRGVPGSFRVVAASMRRVVAARGNLKLVFVRLGARAAARAFLQRRLDEAPVPPGELRAFRLDDALRPLVRVRPLLGVDLVGFRVAGGALGALQVLRRVYWETAARADYAALVPEYGATPAFALLAGDGRAPSMGQVRRARTLVGPLPEVRLKLAVARDADDIYRANLVAAAWRDLGFGPVVFPTADFGRRLAGGDADAWFRRLVAPYPLPEAVLAALLLPDDGRNPWLGRTSAPERLLRRALGAADPHPFLARADAELQSSAAVVPLAGVTSARLVSPRLRGWRQDALGVVDYTKVRARPSGS